MYFYVESGVGLVSKQMYPELVEINESRVTDYRWFPRSGGVRRRVFPISSECLCSNKSYTVQL